MAKRRATLAPSVPGGSPTVSRGATPRTRRPDFESIDRRLSLSFLALASGLAVIVFFAGSALYLRVVRQERQRLSSVIAHILSPGLESVKATGTFRIRNMVAEVRKRDPAIAYIRIIDADGLVVQEGPEPERVQAGDASAREDAATKEVVVRDLRLGDSNVAEIVHMLKGGYQGTWKGVLRIGLYNDSLWMAAKRAGMLMGGLLIILVGLAWPFALWLGRALGAPVQALARDFAGVMDQTPLYIALENEAGVIDQASQSFLTGFDVRLENSPRTDALIPPTALEELKEKPEVCVTLRGEERILHLTRFPVLLSGEGRTIRSGLLGTDVTDWRRDQAERDRLAAAVESAEDALLIAASDRGVIYANPALFRQTGFPREAVLGRAPAEVLAGNTAAREHLAKVDATSVWRDRIVARRHNGETWQCDLMISPIVAGDSGLAQVWAARDVSREVALEQQLRQSQKMEAVGQLAGGVAHDFNNLLTVVLSASELIAQEPLTTSQQENVSLVLTAGKRAAELTRQLLAFSRRQILSIRDVKLNETISGALNLLRRVIGPSIELRFEETKDLWTIRGDEGQLEQVLVNLTINARDAMPDGGRLTVTTENRRLEETPEADGSKVPAGDYVVMTVSDTGAGMQRDVLHHIFEPFFTTKRVGQGTGLGLSTVLGIVKQSGGHIWVSSKPGAGTVFEIAFPRAADGVAGPVAPVDLLDLPELRGHGEKILVVEDEPMVLSVVERMLTHNGYQVTGVPDGVAALEAIESRGQPDLVLSDLIMPRLGGYGLARELAKRFPSLPVLFMSGFNGEVAEASDGLQHVKVIRKPPARPEMLEAVRLAMTRPPAQAPVRAPQERRTRCERLLLVDDDEAIVFLLKRMLTGLGYRITGFTDPDSALKEFRARPDDFDGVITDVSMPKMSGFDLLFELQRTRPGVPVVVTSGYIESGDEEMARTAGARALVPKLNTIDEMAAALDHIFGPPCCAAREPMNSEKRQDERKLGYSPSG